MQQLLLVLHRFNCIIVPYLNEPKFLTRQFPILTFVQSPLGVAIGAIAGHLVATSVAILGGAFLAHYISKKVVGALGSNHHYENCSFLHVRHAIYFHFSIRSATWVEFFSLFFAVATLFGVF